MAFGDIVRSLASPSNWPEGIGGDANTIWHCDHVAAKVYELSITDFSVDRQANSPSSSSRGTGGDAATIWHCDINTDLVYELDAALPAVAVGGNPLAVMADAGLI